MWRWGTFLVLSTAAALLAGIVAACAGTEQGAAAVSEGGVSVSVDVGPAGGLLAACGGVISLPAGALSTTTPLTLSCSPAATVPGYALASPLYTFEPAGLTFAVPITVTLAFQGEPAEPTLFWSQLGGSGYDAIASSVHGSVVVGSITHFSTGFVASAVPLSVGGSDAASDTQADAAFDAGLDADGASVCSLPADPATVGVACGPGRTCTGTDSVCCFDDLSCAPAAATIIYSNASPNGVCQAVARCDGPEDCPAGQVCWAGPDSVCGAEPLPPFPQVCHADSDCPAYAPLCGPPRELISGTSYVLRTCTATCSTDADCTVPSPFPPPFPNAYSTFDLGTCIATPGCESVCGYPPPDAGADAGSDAPFVAPGDGGCVTPYTPGFVPCGSGGTCNVEWDWCCSLGGFSGYNACYPSGAFCTGLDGQPFSTMCDGPEDCPAGQSCAVSAAGAACGPTSACATPFTQVFPLEFSCATTSVCFCHSDLDCTPSFPYCYFNPCASTFQWAQCQAVPPADDAGVAYGSCTGPDAGPTNYGVACGSEICTSQTTQCCSPAGDASAPSCAPRSSGPCPGACTLQCDGPEDCDQGQTCCWGTSPDWGQATFCAGQCAEAEGEPYIPAGIVCRTSTDCPSSQPTCVPNDAGPLSICQ